jgi:hypothetical protein
MNFIIEKKFIAEQKIHRAFPESFDERREPSSLIGWAPNVPNQNFGHFKF